MVKVAQGGDAEGIAETPAATATPRGKKRRAAPAADDKGSVKKVKVKEEQTEDDGAIGGNENEEF